MNQMPFEKQIFLNDFHMAVHKTAFFFPKADFFFFFFQFRMCYTSPTIVTTIKPFWCWKIVILTAFSMTSAQSLRLHVFGLFGGCVIVYLP